MSADDMTAESSAAEPEVLDAADADATGADATAADVDVADADVDVADADATDAEATDGDAVEVTDEPAAKPTAADLLPTGPGAVDDDSGDSAADVSPADLLPTGPMAATKTAEPAEQAEPEVVDEPAPGELRYELVGEDELVYEHDVTPVVKQKSPYDKPGKWFVVHTQSGYEKKVKQNLEARTASMQMESRIFEVVIPMEDVVEFKQGKKVVVQKKVFPGYLLVRCRLDDDSWYVIRNTPGVTGFVGAGNKPSPLARKDVENFLSVKDEGEEVQRKTRPRFIYEMGETVRVKEGPFADFSGEVIEINEDQLKVKVLVNIFGRETPVELEFSQVAKL